MLPGVINTVGEPWQLVKLLICNVANMVFDFVF